jgi:hypothetical protein
MLGLMSFVLMSVHQPGTSCCYLMQYRVHPVVLARRDELPNGLDEQMESLCLAIRWARASCG